MYRKFREDPSSVDPSWHEFLADYSPEPAGNGSQSGSSDTAAPEKKPERSEQAKQSAEKTKAEPEQRTEKKPAKVPVPEGDTQVLRGASAAVVKNMSASLMIPTATSVRAVPAKAMIDNRTVINNHLKRTRGGKISFTHLLGFALVQAVKKFPNMNRCYAEIDGKPNVITPPHTNLGLAIDLAGKDGNRQLVVAGIKK